MVYQRATVKLQTPSDKDISKAMQIAAKTNGKIVSVQIQGQERDQLVVIGEFDSTKLIESLRKKFSFATLMSLQPITESSNNSNYYNSSRNQYDQYYPNYNPTMSTSNSAYNNYHQQPQWPSSSSSSSSSNYYYNAHYPYGYRVVHESEPSTCSIM